MSPRLRTSCSAMRRAGSLRGRRSTLLQPPPIRNSHSISSDGDDTAPTPALDLSRLTTERVAREKRMDESNPAFGTSFTDHMLSIPWSSATGWSAPAIHPVRPLSLHPATSSLHYALQCFEGLKAYHSPRDGSTRLFRPLLNMQRLNRAAARLCLPTFDPHSGVEVLKAFVRAEERFVPKQRGHSLYVRPTLISTEPSIAMFPPKSALLYLIACPVSTFYRSSSASSSSASSSSTTSASTPASAELRDQPRQPAITLSAAPSYIRAFPRGTGSLKLGANYAPCFLPQTEAAGRGHAQNLWLLPSADGADFFLQEVGTMNVFLLMEDARGHKLELVTPPLGSGTILPGVTRASVLELARERLDPRRYVVSEREVGIAEVVAAGRDGRLREVFGTGTAVVVSDVAGVEWEGEMVGCGRDGGGEGEEEKVGPKMKAWLEEIQYGEVESEWSVSVD